MKKPSAKRRRSLNSPHRRGNQYNEIVKRLEEAHKKQSQPQAGGSKTQRRAENCDRNSRKHWGGDAEEAATIEKYPRPRPVAAVKLAQQLVNRPA